MQQLAGNVFFPAYAEIYRANPNKLMAILYKARLALILPSWSLAVLFIFFGAQLMDILYDARYHGSGAMLKAACCGFPCRLCVGILLRCLACGGQGCRHDKADRNPDHLPVWRDVYWISLWGGRRPGDGYRCGQLGSLPCACIRDVSGWTLAIQDRSDIPYGFGVDCCTGLERFFSALTFLPNAQTRRSATTSVERIT